MAFNKNNIYINAFFLVFLFVVQISGSVLIETSNLYTENRDSLISLIRLSNSFKRTDFDKTIDYGKKAFFLAREIGDKRREARAAYNVGFGFSFKTYYDSAKQWLTRSIEIGRELGMDSLLAKALNRQGIVYKTESDYSRAVACFTEALTINEKLGLIRGLGAVNTSLGTLYRSFSEYEKSIEYFLEGLKYYEKDEWVEGRAWSYYSIGNLYGNLGQYEKGITNIKESYNIYQKISDSRPGDKKIGVSICASTLAEQYAENGDFELALHYAREALRYRELQAIPTVLADELKVIGKIHLKKGEPEISRTYLLRALKIKEEIGDLNGLDLILISLAEAETELKNYSRALNYLGRAEKVARIKYRRLSLQNIYYNYYKIELKRNNKGKALDYFQNYTSLKDSIFNLDAAHRIAVLEIEYEVDKQKTENELLKHKTLVQELRLDNAAALRNFLITGIILTLLLAVTVYFRLREKSRMNEKSAGQKKLLEVKNEELKKSEEDLIKLNADKDKLFSIISHDLKSPFNSLMGFARYLHDEFDNLSEDEIRAYTESMYETTNNLYKLIENLLAWSALQIGKVKPEPESIQLKNEVDNIFILFGQIASNKKIELISNVEAGLIIVADKTILNSILRNLISNSLKFTDEGGKVKVSAAIENNRCKICVEDNGIGMNSEELSMLFQLDKHFSKSGTGMETGTGLGLILCKSYIEKIGGNIDVKSSPDKGTIFCFYLPLN